MADNYSNLFIFPAFLYKGFYLNRFFVIIRLKIPKIFRFVYRHAYPPISASLYAALPVVNTLSLYAPN
jgi:hypothetical protein